MLQYLIILLDDTSTSFCHYDNKKESKRLISVDTLERGIIFAMKENLNIQFVYPEYQLPKEYNNVIETIDHTKIKPLAQADGSDIMVMESIQKLTNDYACIVLKTNLNNLSTHRETLFEMFGRVKRLNIVLSDIIHFKDVDFSLYKSLLDDLSDCLVKYYIKGHNVQLNLLTDRTLLNKMNNCNAGDKCITLAPNGRFYICPAYYYEADSDNIGDLDIGISIKNKQLYQLDHAPLCRRCDAFQCKRCIWMNSKTTLDVNIPSHEQCVVAHLERNASRILLQKMKKKGIDTRNTNNITKINYLDPFDIIKL